jgi:hypothetical protein
MKRLFIGMALLALLTGFSGYRQHGVPLRNTSFTKGEVLNYDAFFGIFTVGKGSSVIEKTTYTINSRPCYKVDVQGQTHGFVSWITKVNDQWGAYIDTAAITTHVSYRKLKEGHYRLDELITYDDDKKQAEVKKLNRETGQYEAPKYYPTKGQVRDIVGGFLYLRVIDFRKFDNGDTLTISGFFEDTPYHFKIIYSGKEIVKTRVGKIPCHKLVPIMPDNKLFNGPNSVTAWISDDENKIPVRVSAKMFVGSTGIELTSFKGLRNQLRVVR